MKRLLLLLALGALLVPAVHADNTRVDGVRRVISCEAIIRDFMATPATAIPADVLHRAKAIVIVNQFQGAFFFGVKGGYGVVLAKKPDGRWSVPAFLNASELSLGLQFGGKSVESVYIITDDASIRLLFNNRINFGVDAKAVAGPRVAEAERSSDILSASVLVYQNVTGLYAGATVKTGFLSPNDEGNHIFYSTIYSMPEIIFSDMVQPNPDVTPLMDFVTQITR
jgi:lipid-binding SYLF domain-containing protein